MSAFSNRQSIKDINDQINDASSGDTILASLDAEIATLSSPDKGQQGQAFLDKSLKDSKDDVAAMKRRALGARNSLTKSIKPDPVPDSNASLARDWMTASRADEEAESAATVQALSDKIAKQAAALLTADTSLDERFLRTGSLDNASKLIQDPDSIRTDAERIEDTQFLSGSGVDIEDRIDPKTTETTPATTSLMSRPAKDNVDAIEAYKTEAMEAQKLLGVTVDGDFGPNSTRAMASFQYRAGLPVSGKIDSATMEALRDPKSADPRNAEPKISVLNDAGDAPDISKVKDWAKKNIADPLKAAAFVSTVESETGGRTLIEQGRHFSRLLGRNRTPAEIAKKLGGNTARRKAFNDLSTNPDYINGDTAKKDAMVFDIFYDDQYRGADYKLGNINPGDGSKYKGRGLIQITGRANYKRVGDLLGVDLIANPELINDPKYAAAAAMAYLSLAGKNFFAKDVTQDSLAKTVGHSGGTAEAKKRFDRAIVLQAEMYP